jgi:DNA replication and repair protein RecF
VRITRLQLKDFRCYESFVLEPSAGLTILVGPNAAGKTNVIEAIQLVTAARSFRRPEFSDLVRWGAGGARVNMDAEDGQRRLSTSLTVEKDGRRSYSVNGRASHRHSGITGLLPSVVFTPEDLTIVKGAAERRRSAVDELGEQLSATYGSLRRDYGRVVRQRNALLRDEPTGDALSSWDEQLIALGSRLVMHRVGLLERVMAHASRRYSELAGGEVLEYAYSDRCGLGSCDSLRKDEVETAIREQLSTRRAEERRRAITLVGPHRDDIVFSVDGEDARSFGSQGQQRTIALAWKLAEVEMVEEVLKRTPILLLDDVMSELDAERRDALSRVVASEIQTVVTTTTTGYFSHETLERATIVPIERGRT